MARIIKLEDRIEMIETALVSVTATLNKVVTVLGDALDVMDDAGTKTKKKVKAKTKLDKENRRQ
tara:strand:+ start:287 stop:478 length:192 start_codon:yes stop_codon:yes gene_type:complete